MLCEHEPLGPGDVQGSPGGSRGPSRGRPRAPSRGALVMLAPQDPALPTGPGRPRPWPCQAWLLGALGRGPGSHQYSARVRALINHCQTRPSNKAGFLQGRLILPIVRAAPMAAKQPKQHIKERKNEKNRGGREEAFPLQPSDGRSAARFKLFIHL